MKTFRGICDIHHLNSSLRIVFEKILLFLIVQNFILKIQNIFVFRQDGKQFHAKNLPSFEISEKNWRKLFNTAIKNIHDIVLSDTKLFP